MKEQKHSFYIGPIITRLRKEAGLSQEVFAGRCKMNRGHISEIETNKKHPYVETLLKLAIGLDMPVEKLAKMIEEEANYKEIFEKLPIK